MLSRVPIPRLRNWHHGQKSRRVAHACDECRSRKSKCDGERPICAQCIAVGLETCVYSESKRTQERKQLESAKREIDRYDKLLREISQEVDESIAKKIAKVLRPSPRGQAPLWEASDSSSVASSSSVGSLDPPHTLDEDLNRSEDSRATGYLGKSSEVVWMQSLEREARDHSGNEGKSENSQNPRSSTAVPMTSMNYRIESATYPVLEDNNPYHLPSKALADRLLQMYLDSIQPSLPVIRQDLFTEQFKSLYSRELTYPGRKWLAVLNLIFAISSRLCQFSGQDIHNEDHQFFSRAQKLNISESVVEDHEDLQQVQVETLAAFYLFTCSQINRAWKMIGTATRSGIALGLHLRATHNNLNASALEARHKLWWTIFILENLLSVMTGRDSALGNTFCSAPPPLVSEDMERFADRTPETRLERPLENPRMKWTIHQQHKQLKAQRASMKLMDPSDSLYFFCLVDLILISHTASTRVYSTDTMKQGWDRIYRRIGFYNGIMEEWSSSLPDSMSFQVVDAEQTTTSRNVYQVSLAMHYYSSRITLNRPCLTRRRDAGNSGTNSRARKETAMTCLQSAIAIISIFPHEPDPVWACYVPWWNVLHYLVQATTVLLINMSLDCSPSKNQRIPSFSNNPNAGHFPGSSGVTGSEAIRSAVKKALHWLYRLGETDDSARRAFELCNNCIHRIAPPGFDLDNFASANTESKVPDLAVPTDQTHQQHRTRVDVSHSQFAGTANFGYDSSNGIVTLSPEQGATGNFDLSQQPSCGVVRDDIDMSDNIPGLDYATLDEMLHSLAGQDDEVA